MSLAALTITDTETGRTRTIMEDWDEYSEYLWEDGGNFSCDCNRGLFCYDWEWEPPDGWPCGDRRFELDVTHLG